MFWLFVVMYLIQIPIAYLLLKRDCTVTWGLKWTVGTRYLSILIALMPLIGPMVGLMTVFFAMFNNNDEASW